jgi:tripartite-type tricarboxylate transporter receptor subunit TctC
VKNHLGAFSIFPGNIMNMQRRHLVAAAGCVLASATLPALAQTAAAYPVKPVTLIVPNAPGGAVDLLARLLEKPLQQSLGQPILVVYKPGAGTVMGTDFVAKSAPDGYTLGLVVTSHVINPSLRPQMPFDTTRDLTGVSLLATSPIAISARPDLPVKNLKELIDYARQHPGKLSYASPGAGSSMHLAAELLKLTAGIDMLHTPYKGSGGAYQDVFGGRVDLIFDPLFSSLPHIKSGRMKAIAVIGPKRSPIAPDLAVANETLPGFTVDSIFGLVAPAATPPDVVQKISAEIARILATPEMRARMADVGLTPVGSSPQEFNELIRKEMARWSKVVKQAGVKLD